MDKWWQQLQQSALWQRGQQFYYGLPPRDRLALAGLSAFFAVLLLVYGVLVPVTDYHRRAQANFDAARETLAWMEANRHAVQTTKTVDREGQSLLGIANRSAKRFQLLFKRYEPVGDNGLNLWLEGVNFDQMIAWLGLLQDQYAISVQEIAVDRQKDEGRVNVRLVLRG